MLDSFYWLVCFLLVHFRSSLCILERTQLSDRSFANVLTQFMICLFILLTESLAEKDGEFDFELLSYEQPLWHQEGNAKQMAGGSPRDPNERV